MKFTVAKISGIDDALVSLMMSKRRYTPQKEKAMRELVYTCTDMDGFYHEGWYPTNKEQYDEFFRQMGLLKKYGLEQEHTTLLRFIDITVMVEGLHRGAQDDLDAHAYRMNNRIVRESTRLAVFETGEKSDWYKDKIMSYEEVAESLGMEMPETLETPQGTVWKKAKFGYVREGYEEDKDVLRGNYPMSIPSRCIFKIQLPELMHIYRMRGIHSTAHPELVEGIEQLVADLSTKMAVLGSLVTCENCIIDFSIGSNESVSYTFGFMHVADTVRVDKDVLDFVMRAHMKHCNSSKGI